jgi:DNA-binding IclR family transcriptional regulator
MVRPGNRVCETLQIGEAGKGRRKHGEIAQALHIPKDRLPELPSSLVVRDYLTIDTISGTYAIGPQALVLANSYLARLDIVQIAQPTVRQAMIKTGESASLNHS